MALLWEHSYWIEKENITLENTLQKGDECTFTYNLADKSLTVTKGKPQPYKAVYIFGGVNVNEWDNTEKYAKMECNEGVYTYNFTYDGKNAFWAFRALRRNGTWASTSCRMRKLPLLLHKYLKKWTTETARLSATAD